VASPTPAERLAQADRVLAQVNATLERLWLERHHLYACIRDVKTLRRNLELARASIEVEK
jgi:hypothetical protein